MSSNKFEVFMTNTGIITRLAQRNDLNGHPWMHKGGTADHSTATFVRKSEPWDYGGGISVPQPYRMNIRLILNQLHSKSVWQYYNSPWMITPWTHESIQLLNEGTGLRPGKSTSIPGDKVVGSSECEVRGYLLCQRSREADDIRARQNALYNKTVLPLKRLSDAYRGDWDIQSLPTTNPTETISQQNISNKPITASESPLQADFTVAMFCALPLEVDAVTVLFDGFYQDSTLYQNAPGDSNTYTLGRMGRHHAVLVHLPGMGKSVASQAASSIRLSYPNIRLALVVGICGGVQYKKGHAEILLGDIVVSDGIVQHDFGRRVPGAFLRKTSVTDVLGRHNVAIRGFLSKIKTTMAMNQIGSKIEKYLEAINRTLGNDTVRYPEVEQDEVFQPTYQHKHHDPVACSSCAHSTNSTVCDEVFDLSCSQLNCDKDKLVQRKRLQTALTLGHTPSATIHVGLIASGDTVMESGQDRGLIAIQDNVIAFEMEGAGVWDSLPCLVVKGVCDYADSHKNKIWQPCAAATGAACMKALLDEWTL